ncbi:hypothetical protein B046DRAFT_01003 [Streptomyces sp. LamerLS-316]|uniref:hypothetical protein n=1 Tax=unclassified Streptomyces TaxID=2593676 RepID=UPI000823C0A0|nr:MULTISPECIES: hypothetical protein [unclassified Streptomyces]MYQ39986.1 hypothetical protein [Streptomyces sp. SID4921]SCK12272.1 hypothetical protein B046DRAFT_01003 [Streptomyces sp. LamerLS-316]
MLPLAWAPQESHVPVDADAVTFALPRFTLRTKVRITVRLAALGVVVLDGTADVPLLAGRQADIPAYEG